MTTPRPPALGPAPIVLIASALLAVAFTRGDGSKAAPAAAAASAASAPALSSAAPHQPAGALAGTWRQSCQPYLPGDGASDISYTISLKGADGLHLAGVTKDYRNTTCSGAGSVIATPQFTQKIVGQATLGGVPVLRLVDEGAALAAASDSKSIVGIDRGQLRFGDATGARDSDGFPARFEKPADAYNKQ